MAYSSLSQVEAFKRRLVSGVEGDIRENGVTPDRRPMWVLDMDGNIAHGYNLAPGKTLPLGSKDNPKTQSIPSDADISHHLEQGNIDRAIFSVKPMDSRLPKNIVDALNAAEKDGRNFDIVLLTSRSTEDAQKILRYSGVENPERASLIGDSGAIMRINGKERVTRLLKTKEREFLNDLEGGNIKTRLESVVDAVFAAEGFDVKNRPPLQIEAKSIASNVHFGEILKAAQQPEDSALGDALAAALRKELEHYVAEQSPAKDGKPVFTLLDGPSTLEVKVAAVDKGKGLEAAVDAAIASGYRPSSVIFAGDDVSKKHPDGHVSHGTDFPAFAAAPAIAQKTAIPVLTVHTHHPVDERVDPRFLFANPAKEAVGVHPDLVVALPEQTGNLVVESIRRALERASEIGKSARQRIQDSSASASRQR